MPVAVPAVTRAGFVLVSLGAVACSRGASSPPDALAPAVDPVEAVVCAARSGCRLESKLEEKPTLDGGAEAVALVSLGKAGSHPGPLSSATWWGMRVERGDAACFPWELWLTRSRGASIERGQLLISDCTSDIHGLAPRVVDLGGRRVRYTPEPSQNQYSLDSLDFALDPPSFQRERTVLQGRELTWDWESFRGQACKRATCAPALPEVSLGDGGFARGGWKTTALGDCSMLVDGSPGDISRGVVSGGKPTAAFRLLLSEEKLYVSGGTLYVEVTDDIFVTGGPVVDTLDFEWLVPEARSDETSRHERLRMDGKLRDATGKVTTADMSVTPTSRRFALPAASWILYDQWAATYEDTDDGRTLAGSLSTGSPEMPPPVFSAPGACVAQGGALRPVHTGPINPSTALVP